MGEWVSFNRWRLGQLKSLRAQVWLFCLLLWSVALGSGSASQSPHETASYQHGYARGLSSQQPSESSSPDSVNQFSRDFISWKQSWDPSLRYSLDHAIHGAVLNSRKGRLLSEADWDRIRTELAGWVDRGDEVFRKHSARLETDSRFRHGFRLWVFQYFELIQNTLSLRLLGGADWNEVSSHNQSLSLRMTDEMAAVLGSALAPLQWSIGAFTGSFLRSARVNSDIQVSLDEGYLAGLALGLKMTVPLGRKGRLSRDNYLEMARLLLYYEQVQQIALVNDLLGTDLSQSSSENNWRDIHQALPGQGREIFLSLEQSLQRDRARRKILAEIDFRLSSRDLDVLFRSDILSKVATELGLGADPSALERVRELYSESLTLNFDDVMANLVLMGVIPIESYQGGELSHAIARYRLRALHAVMQGTTQKLLALDPEAGQLADSSDAIDKNSPQATFHRIAGLWSVQIQKIPSEFRAVSTSGGISQSIKLNRDRSHKLTLFYSSLLAGASELDQASRAHSIDMRVALQTLEPSLSALQPSGTTLIAGLPSLRDQIDRLGQQPGYRAAEQFYFQVEDSLAHALKGIKEDLSRKGDLHADWKRMTVQRLEADIAAWKKIGTLLRFGEIPQRRVLPVAAHEIFPDSEPGFLKKSFYALKGAPAPRTSNYQEVLHRNIRSLYPLLTLEIDGKELWKLMLAEGRIVTEQNYSALHALIQKALVQNLKSMHEQREKIASMKELKDFQEILTATGSSRLVLSQAPQTREAHQAILNELLEPNAIERLDGSLVTPVMSSIGTVYLASLVVQIAKWGLSAATPAAGRAAQVIVQGSDRFLRGFHGVFWASFSAKSIADLHQYRKSARVYQAKRELYHASVVGSSFVSPEELDTLELVEGQAFRSMTLNFAIMGGMGALRAYMKWVRVPQIRKVAQDYQSDLESFHMLGMRPSFQKTSIELAFQNRMNELEKALRPKDVTGAAAEKAEESLSQISRGEIFLARQRLERARDFLLGRIEKGQTWRPEVLFRREMIQVFQSNRVTGEISTAERTVVEKMIRGEALPGRLADIFPEHIRTFDRVSVKLNVREKELLGMLRLNERLIGMEAGVAGGKSTSAGRNPSQERNPQSLSKMIEDQLREKRQIFQQQLQSLCEKSQGNVEFLYYSASTFQLASSLVSDLDDLEDFAGSPDPATFQKYAPLYLNHYLEKLKVLDSMSGCEDERFEIARFVQLKWEQKFGERFVKRYGGVVGVSTWTGSIFGLGLVHMMRGSAVGKYFSVLRMLYPLAAAAGGHELGRHYVKSRAFNESFPPPPAFIVGLGIPLGRSGQMDLQEVQTEFKNVILTFVTYPMVHMASGKIAQAVWSQRNAAGRWRYAAQSMRGVGKGKRAESTASRVSRLGQVASKAGSVVNAVDIRRLVIEVMLGATVFYGIDWWVEHRAPELLNKEVEKARARLLKEGIHPEAVDLFQFELMRRHQYYVHPLLYSLGEEAIGAQAEAKIGDFQRKMSSERMAQEFTGSIEAKLFRGMYIKYRALQTLAWELDGEILDVPETGKLGQDIVVVLDRLRPEMRDSGRIREEILMMDTTLLNLYEREIPNHLGLSLMWGAAFFRKMDRPQEAKFLANKAMSHMLEIDAIYSQMPPKPVESQKGASR